MIKKISNTSSEMFNKSMEIYETSFPHKERHSPEVIKQRIRSGKEFLFVWIKNDEVIGIALFWDLLINNIVIMDYFAVDEEYRNIGIGEQFLNKILEHFKKHNVNLLIEIENPLMENSEIKTRRFRFYEKIGFKLIENFEYLMPSINNLGPVDMVLMVAPNENLFKFSKKQMKLIIGIIYQELYYQDKKSNFYKEEIRKIKNDFWIKS